MGKEAWGGTQRQRGERQGRIEIEVEIQREGGQAGEEGGGGETFLAGPSDFHGSRKDVGRCGDVNTQPWPPQAHVLSRDNLP